MIQIIDNFLPEEEFNSIKSVMMGYEFPWYINTLGLVDKDDGGFQFGHIFFQPEGGLNSEHINMWNTFMNKVEAKKCVRIKARSKIGRASCRERV